MCRAHVYRCVGCDVLCAPCASPPQVALYGRPPPRFRRTLPHWTVSRWAFVDDPFTQWCRQLLHIPKMDISLVGHLFVGHIPSHAIQTPHPHVQGLMRPSKTRIGQIIKTCVTGGTLRALPCSCRVIKAALDDWCGRTRWTLDAGWPASLAYRLIPLTIIDHILDVHRHRWTPGRVWDMGWHQCTRSSHPRPWNPI